VAVDHHRSDDFTPYAFMTTDYGKSWKKIVNGLPADDYVKVIRQDPHYENLLYIGMEHGIYASWDSGKNWTRINNNLPPASVRDLRIQPRERDLIVGTHGRGAWILDDIRPLQELADASNKAVHLFQSRKATRWHLYNRLESQGQRRYAAKNPEYGAYINFHLANDAKDPVTVTITDVSGNLVRTLEDSTAKAGLNRIVWDLRRKEATKLKTPLRGGRRSGPFRPWVLPGMYTATLKAAGQELQTSIEVASDPRLALTREDYLAQSNAVDELNGLLSQVHGLLNDSDFLKNQLTALKEKLTYNKEPLQESQTVASKTPDTGKPAVKMIEQALKDIKAIRSQWTRPPPRMNYRQTPQLRDEIRSLMRNIDGATAKPTQSQLTRIEQLKSETQSAQTTYKAFLEGSIKPINEKVQSMPQIVSGT
jgi:hypothetical protein